MTKNIFVTNESISPMAKIISVRTGNNDGMTKIMFLITSKPGSALICFGARLCAKHQPQRVRNWIRFGPMKRAKPSLALLRLVFQTQPRSVLALPEALGRNRPSGRSGREEPEDMFME